MVSGHIGDKEGIIISDPHASGEFLLYQTEDAQIRIQVRLTDGILWLTQQQMAELFQTSKQNISHHVRSIYAEGELAAEAAVKNYLTIQREGKREVQRQIEYYNLDMVISVGYRVKSLIATRFRIWATGQLKESPNTTRMRSNEQAAMKRNSSQIYAVLS